MAKRGIPDPLKRRHWIEEDLTPSRALEVAEAYLAAGRAIEAIVFLQKAEASERMAELLEEAAQAGDAFLVRALAAALGEEVPVETWERVASAADAVGKERYAKEARRQAQRG